MTRWTHRWLDPESQCDETRSRIQKLMTTLVFVYIIEEVDHAYAQNAPLERFLSMIHWRVVQAVERDLVIDVHA